MIPLRDENPTTLTPFVTVAIIVVNVVVYLYQVSLGPSEESFVMTYAAIPAELFHRIENISPVPVWTTVFTSMFLHGGFMHLAGNMLYLWIFGNNIEDVLGHGRFLAFFLLTGIVAVYAHALTAPDSTMPMIGASGAISGVLGAYIFLFPHARVQVLIWLGFFVRIMPIRAMVVLGFWILMQFFNAVFSAGDLGGGVAWFAHVGGFLAGLILIKFFQPRVISASEW